MKLRATKWLCCVLLAACGSEPKPQGSETPDMPPDMPPDVPPDFEPPTEPKLRFVPIKLGVSRATDFEFVPGADDELLVITQAGNVQRTRLSGNSASALAAGKLTVFEEAGCGLLSMVFDPEFTSNGYVYFGRCRDMLTSTLSRYDLSSLSELEASEAEIMSITVESMPPEQWHRWGSLGFEPDGETMWALHGDMFVRELAQDVTTRHGSLLRFLPNREADGSGFSAVEGNAADTISDADPTVYSYGLRSPWRGYRDSNGRFWVGDVGLETTEEVDLISEPGQNMGWPNAEGPCKKSCAALTDPLLSFGRSSDEPYVIEDPDTEPAVRRAVWVGAGYEAPSVDRYYGLLDGVVLYGDFFTGWVRGAQVDDDGALTSDRLLGHLTDVTSVKVGPDGYLYLLTLGGTLYRAEQVVE